MTSNRSNKRQRKNQILGEFQQPMPRRHLHMMLKILKRR
jgi:hypothetical protein